jgi:hypothetical protein
MRTAEEGKINEVEQYNDGCMLYCNKVKVKVKVLPITGHEGPEGE